MAEPGGPEGVRSPIVAAVKARGCTYLPVPDHIVKLANFRDADLFSATLEPDGSLIFKRVDSEAEKESTEAAKAVRQDRGR